jgi:hypothetical protein
MTASESASERRSELVARADARARAAARALLAFGGPQAARIDNNRATRAVALRVLPLAVAQRFDASMARDLDVVLELRIFASPGGGEVRYGLWVSHGALTIRRGAPNDARAWVGGALGDLILVVAGSVPWTEMLATGRLQLGGDPFMALRVPGLLSF